MDDTFHAATQSIHAAYARSQGAHATRQTKRQTSAQAAAARQDAAETARANGQRWAAAEFAALEGLHEGGRTLLLWQARRSSILGGVAIALLALLALGAVLIFRQVRQARAEAATATQAVIVAQQNATATADTGTAIAAATMGQATSAAAAATTDALLTQTATAAQAQAVAAHQTVAVTQTAVAAETTRQAVATATWAAAEAANRAADSATAQAATAAAPAASRIDSVRLVNARTDRSVQNLADGDTISLARAGRYLNVEVTAGVGVESVKFYLDGELFCANGRCVENSAPYAMAGDLNGNYYDNWDWQGLLGTHTIGVFACSRDGGDSCDAPLNITLTVTR